jgi:hypothetical protein
LLKNYLKVKYWKKNYRLSYYKRKIISKSKINLVVLYKKFSLKINKILLNFTDIYTTCFFLNTPKRQYIFCFWDLKLNKIVNTTTGKLLKLIVKNFNKFLKRSIKSLPLLILHFKANDFYLFKNIYLFKLKNFNKKQFDFFKKFCILLKPNVHYLVHKQSYIPRFLPKRRIKRSVLKLINKI